MNSELRQDLVSGDWVVIAPNRSKRLSQLVKKEKRIKAPKKGCPFENPQESGNGEPIILYKNSHDWLVQVIPNKYPAFIPGVHKIKIKKNGPYQTVDGVGYHDLVITRDHDKNFSALPFKEANLVFRAFRERYKTLAEDPCSAYVSIFHNWGPRAGASVYHPHYQIIAIPVVPPDVNHSLSGSFNYFKKNKKCVHCVMIEHEKKIKSRIVYENKEAIVFAPFVSREPFELRVFPKKHFSCFEDTPDGVMEMMVDALQASLNKMERKLGDPDYNFFIHTAPILNKKKYGYYHWHIEVQPKISISAGFELSTGIEITVVDPDDAAKILKS
jgi:UDPglucose--hexose-1-phosphate uridylyltransferase